VDFPGDDFTIHEVGPTPDGYNVYYSEFPYGGTWYYLGTGYGTTSFDISSLSTDTIRYLKIEDDNDGSATELYPGCDIDAITHPREPVSMPGDVNADYLVNLSDVIYLANHLMKSGPAPIPFEAGDLNCDCEVNLGDVIYLANYLLKSGTPPVPIQECECEYRF
jgi:hypothetical protein